MNVNRYRGASRDYPLLLPLLDLVLLLFVFFLFLNALNPRVFEVNFSTSGTTDKTEQTVVRLDPTGQLYMAGEWYTVSELAERLRQEPRSGDQRKVVVVVDAGSRFSTIQSIIQELHDRGIQPAIEITVDRPSKNE